MIADIGAAGLGMPDRDYYLKPEQRFKDAREKYVVHVANIFKLAGYNQADATKAANTVMQFETALAKASLDNVAKRDPQQLDHMMSFDAMTKLAPHFDWAAYFESAKIPRESLNVEEPQFLQEFDTQLTGASIADWKTYLAWHLLHEAAPYLSEPFVDENFAFYQKELEGRSELKPRWKQCSEAADNLLGDPLGKEYVTRYFPPEAKARAKEMVKNILAAMTDTVQSLDWMTPETKKRALDKLSTFDVRVGYPDKWRDFSTRRYHARIVLYRRDERREIPRGRQPRADRQAHRSHSVGADAANVRCRLQSAVEHDLVSGRHLAAARVQHELC